MRAFLRVVCLAAKIIACTLPSAAYAQPVPAVPALDVEAQIQEGLRRQEERNRILQRATEPNVDILKPSASTQAKELLTEDVNCLVITAIDFSGEGAQRFPWLQSVVKPYLRKCLGVSRLSQLVSNLDEELLERGFATTRASLPPQNLQQGKLQILLSLGVVAELRMVQSQSNKPDIQWGTWRNAFPVNSGDLLNIRDIEQGVEQMKRLHSQNVITKLEPGIEPNTSIVIIERMPIELSSRIRGGLTLDNSGGQTLGRTQFSGNLALDNLLGLNDIVGLTLNSNFEKPKASHQSQSLGLNYSVPWGYNNFSLGFSQSKFAQYVQGTTARFLSSGTSWSSDAKLSRTLLRTGSAKLSVYSSVTLRRANSFLEDVELLVQRRRTTTLEAGLNYKKLFEKSSLDIDLAVRKGMPWRQAQEDFDSAQEGGLTLRPKIITASVSYATSTPLGKSTEKSAARTVQYSVNLRGQHTQANTLSIDQLAIGGRGSVRGFDGDAVLIAENGFVLRNEFTTPLRVIDSVDSNLVLGFDMGRVFGSSDIALAGQKLAGLAVGLRGRVGALNFDINVAKPIYAPSGFKTKAVSLYASITHAF